MESILTLLGTLLMVVLLLFLCFWFTRKLGRLSCGNQQSKYMKILDQMILGQDRSLLITQVGEKYLLISMASDRIELLTELEAADLVEFSKGQKGIPPASFKELLNKIRNQEKE